MKKLQLTIRPWILIASVATLLLGITPVYAKSASLYLSPNSGTYGNQTFSVEVNAASADDAINSISGTITFPSDKLQVVGVSTTGSVIDTWISPPGYSNNDGTISFEGIITGTAFQGDQGKVLGITFQTKYPGTAKVSFSQASMLKNDENGTDILTGTGGGTYTLAFQAPAQDQLHSAASDQSQGQSLDPTIAAQLPAAPTVTSSTHPDPNQWYPNNNPTFNWKITSDITGVKIYMDQNPTTNLNEKSDGIFTTYTYHHVANGIWYFHIRLENKTGWGNTAHMKIMIGSKNITAVAMKNQTQFTATQTKQNVQSVSTSQKTMQATQRPSAPEMPTTSEPTTPNDSGLQVIFAVALMILFGTGLFYELDLAKVVKKELKKLSRKRK